ncbi:LemA family protein [Candidatus Zixiibacteriota bacterium]
MEVFWIILILLAVVLFFVIGTYNSLVQLRNRVRNSWSQIDVQLKRRYDLIPNLVEVVKDYMEYEQETLQRVIEARNQAIDASGVKDQGAAENMLTGALRQLFALVENYPDLKANQNVLSLQEELTSTENKISFSRQHYNDMVMTFNTRTEQFPANIVAGMFNFGQEDFFEIGETEREVPKVDLR